MELFWTVSGIAALLILAFVIYRVGWLSGHHAAHERLDAIVKKNGGAVGSSFWEPGA